MLFVSIWSSFAIALWILNRERKRKTVPNIQQFCRWKAVVLFVTGIIGGAGFKQSMQPVFWRHFYFFCWVRTWHLHLRGYHIAVLCHGEDGDSHNCRFNGWVYINQLNTCVVFILALCSMFGFYWRAVIMEDVEPIVYDVIFKCWMTI